MFDRLRKAFSASGSSASTPGRPVTNRDVSRWAAGQRLAIVAHATDGHFDLGGDIHGHPWRLECGAPTRDYVQGLELRGRADVGADPDAAVMVINRPLQEVLEGTVYDAITDTLQTAVSSSLPEEMRWLSMYEEMSWPGLPASFREHFTVVSERIELAQRWIHAPVVSQLLNAVEGEGGAERAKSPLVLMLARGRVYLRMEHTQRSLAEIAHAKQLLLVAGQAALQNLPPMSVAGPDDEPGIAG
ncbi:MULTISPECIES: hypothetical protein [unclassified Acidovorax]|uniref:hypothetical protein n=1 Tax=unclassified Acidovorax TaxID=2684926 RepID=UPI001C44EC4D|nr:MULTISPECIES: hypothetical protein [unclassified Acidovorax]MBV7429899.1 hypothetical protein [Acidovorax sp. sif0732]MBV7451292.1 hypothetical protein [Acidovorax sp. sif0715]